MKVCFFVANLGDGGAQRQCVALLNTLQCDPDLDLHLVLLDGGEHERDLRTSGLTIHRTSVGNYASPAALVFLIRALRRIRPDLLISWLHPADIWSYVATRVVRGVPWIITERGSSYPDQPVYNVRQRFGRWGAAAVIANSEPGRTLWATSAPATPKLVIPNIALSTTPATDCDSDRIDSRECLFVGRLEPQKNVVAMTAAFARFAMTCPQASLTVVGKGALADEVLQVASSAGVGRQLQLLGFRSDVPQLMSRARILLSFSRNEGMPNVLMEAVAAGLPAVVSDIPEHHALLGSEYPYYVPLDSTPEDAAQVIKLAWGTDDATVDRIYLHARRILTASTPAHVAHSYVEAFAQVLATGTWGGRAARARSATKRRFRKR